MARVHGTLISETLGKSATFYNTLEEMYNEGFKLLNNKSYYIAFDPSTSSLGIGISPSDFSFQMLFRIEREDERFENFMMRVHKWLRWIIAGQKIELLIHERPPWDIQKKKGRVGYQALMKFIDILSYWKETTTELQNAVSDSVLPNEWRSAIVDKSKGIYTSNGVRRFSSKVENAKDMVDRFPLLKQYFYEHNDSGSFDGFDACGILHGYLINRFGSEYRTGGVERIVGNIEKSNPALILCKQLTAEEMGNVNIVWSGLEMLKDMSPKKLAINDKYSFYENVRTAIGSNALTLTVLEDPSLIAEAVWQFDEAPKPGKYFLLFIIKLKEGSKVLVGKRLQKYLTETFSYTYV